MKTKSLILATIVAVAVILLYVSTSLASTSSLPADAADGDPFIFLPLIARNYCAEVSYLDDFSNPSTGWHVFDNGNTRWEYLDGEYRILHRIAQRWGTSRSPAPHVYTYTVSVDVRNVTGSYGSYGIIFDAEFYNWFYTFEIDRDGYFALFKFDYSTWTPIAGGQSAYINTGIASNHIAVERNGPTIQVLVNGRPVLTIADGGPWGMRLTGLIAVAYDEPNVDTRFDNFRVCGSTSATGRELSPGLVEGPITAAGSLATVQRSQPKARLKELLAVGSRHLNANDAEGQTE